MALSLAAAAAAASLGCIEGGMSFREEVGVVSGAGMSHLDLRFFLGGSPMDSLGGIIFEEGYGQNINHQSTHP